MPVMLRIEGKAKKIADSILGVPSNMRNKRKTASKNKQRLYAERTRPVR